MGTTSPGVLRWGGERARTGHWRGEREVALLAPVANSRPPSPEFLRHCLAALADEGYRKVVTGALSPLEQTGFLAAGFAVEQRLHLLGLDLDERLAPVPAGLRLARASRRRWPEVLAVDRAAFSTFWRFDDRGLDEALGATPRTRFRLAETDDGRLVGYAICGRAGSRGYVQRLAVVPDEQGRGTGRRLLLDGLHWLRRHGARHAVVNTQVDNDVALGLYHGIGFRDRPTGLSVLSAGLS